MKLFYRVFLLLLLFFSVTAVGRTEMKARCLNDAGQLVLCHLGLDPQVFRWRFKNQNIWQHASLAHVNRVVRINPDQSQPGVIAWEVDNDYLPEPSKKPQEPNKAYIPIPLSSDSKVFYSLTYADTAGVKKWLYLGVSSSDSSVLESYLESMTGRVIEVRK